MEETEDWAPPRARGCMPLLSGSAIDPDSMEPDYNAAVTIEAVG